MNISEVVIVPNWCNNSILVDGEKAELEKLKSFVKGEKTWLDFEKVIPLTETKAEAKILWDSLSIKEQKERWKDDFENFWFNVGKGYEWCQKNWGTKWNSDCREPDYSGDTLMYIFDTAWSPSEPITKVLIEKFPKLKFVHEYEECGIEFAGILSGEKGKITDERCWDIESFECPECENWFDMPRTDEDEVKCTDCGKIFKKNEVDKDAEN